MSLRSPTSPRNMEETATNPFHEVRPTPHQHFVLHLFAAVFRLINHVRRLSESNGDDLEAVFEQYPFLAGYFGEMLALMPDETTWEEGPGWWEQQITAWEQLHEAALPLCALTAEGNVDFNGRLTLILVGLVEEDSRFGTLFAALQAPLVQRRPCLELVGHIMGEGTTVNPWRTSHPLLKAGMLAADYRDAPRSEWVLRVPGPIWDALRGDGASPIPHCAYNPPAAFPAIADLILPEAFRGKVAHLPALLRSGQAQTVIARGTPGSDRLQVAGAVAQALGKGIIVAEGPAANEPPAELGPLCLLNRALPVVVYDLGPGETAVVPRLAGYHGPLFILIGESGGVRTDGAGGAVTLSLPPTNPQLRRQQWLMAFDGQPVADLEAISERFRLPGGYIRQAARIATLHAAVHEDEVVGMAHVQAACRTLNRQQLDTLATRLETAGGWDRLIVSQAIETRLHELESRCRHRERLRDHLGAAFTYTHNAGVRALFTGNSGTGKTLAARILAAELGMDLYRVDLAAVVNKYIGETEKNLHRVLSRAEELDVILLLDEGDALLGGRTEVRSANDRYANLETDYLLQRLEHYQGIVVVTTNAAENIDSAFQRRMDVVVNFVAPQAEERWRIWQLHLPQDHLVDEVLLEMVAVRCELTGGQIRNAALQATLLALNGGHSLSAWHLEQAIQGEYRKAGATCPLGNGRHAQAGMGAFLDAFAGD